MCTHTHTYTRAHHHPRSPHVHPTPLHAHVHTHTHVCNHILPDNQEQRSACKPTSLHTQKRATPPLHNRTYTHAAMLPHLCTLTSVHVHQHAPCTPSYLQAHPCTDTHALPQPFAHSHARMRVQPTIPTLPCAKPRSLHTDVHTNVCTPILARSLVHTHIRATAPFTQPRTRRHTCKPIPTHTCTPDPPLPLHTSVQR